MKRAFTFCTTALLLLVVRSAEAQQAATGERISVPLGEQKADPALRRRGPGSRLIAKKIEGKQ